MAILCPIWSGAQTDGKINFNEKCGAWHAFWLFDSELIKKGFLLNWFGVVFCWVCWIEFEWLIIILLQSYYLGTGLRAIGTITIPNNKAGIIIFTDIGSFFFVYCTSILSLNLQLPLSTKSRWEPFPTHVNFGERRFFAYQNSFANFL